MTQRKATDHWDLLASELGAAPPMEEAKQVETPETEPATIADEEAEEPAPPAVEPVAARVVPSVEPSVERAAPKPAPKPSAPKAPEPRPLSDWDLLADELGITPQEPPRAAVVEVSHTPESPQFAAEVFNDRSIRFEESVEVFEKTEVVEEDRGFGASEEAAFEQEAGEESARDAEGEPRRRRRRRRRKPRGGQELHGDQEPILEQPGEMEEEIPFADLPEAFEPGPAAAEEEEAAGAAEPAEEDAGAPRSRRRRTRRGGRKGRAGEPAAAVQEEPAEPVAEASIEESVEEPAEEAPPPRREENDKRRKRRESPRAKQRRPEQPRPERPAEPAELDDEAGDDAEILHEGHRGIPTWQEAISLIVDANLESRAKRPDSGRSRGHGGPRDGHGRRDQRGSGRRH